MPTYLLHCHHWESEPGSWSAGGFGLHVKFVQWSKECVFAILSNCMPHWKRVAESLVKNTASTVP
jgi:hypothetical protein